MESEGRRRFVGLNGVYRHGASRKNRRRRRRRRKERV